MVSASQPQDENVFVYVSCHRCGPYVNGPGLHATPEDGLGPRINSVQITKKILFPNDRSGVLLREHLTIQNSSHTWVLKAKEQSNYHITFGAEGIVIREKAHKHDIGIVLSKCNGTEELESDIDIE